MSETVTCASDAGGGVGDARTPRTGREGGGTPRTERARGDGTTARKRRRSELGPLATMGDLKTTPMQTPTWGAGDGFNLAKRASLGSGPFARSGGTESGGRGRRRARRDSESVRDVCAPRFDDGARERGSESPRARAEEETPGSEWGGTSPGEHGGSQYVSSPVCSRDDSGSDLEMDARLRTAQKDGGVNAEEETETKKKERKVELYPIFSRGRKTVHLVRHGQSTWNAANAGPGSWDEPKMFDAALTELGRKQAKSLGPELSKIPRDAVWVSSPLTRALETCLIGRKAGLEYKASRLKKKGSPDENVDDANTPSGTTAKDFDPEREYEEWTKSVIIRHDLTEKLSCTGDVGRPTHCLREEFPELELALSRIPSDRWWWDCERKPNDAQSRQFNSREPMSHFKQRVERFRSWLLKRKEKTFVVFGHSEFFKEFSGNHRSMKNCEIHEMRL